MVENILIIAATAIFMEAFAWFSHKYVMHGPLWFIHKSHHSKKKAIIELNDLFAIIWAVLSASLIIFGNIYTKYNALSLIGIGVAVYGVFYFLFHDIIVHQRLKFKFKTSNKYLMRIIKAHHIHHKSFEKNDSEAFGFLYATKKYASKR